MCESICFNLGQSGNCNVDCKLLLDGECQYPVEMQDSLLEEINRLKDEVDNLRDAINEYCGICDGHCNICPLDKVRKNE